LAELTPQNGLVRGKGTRSMKCSTIELAKRMRRQAHWEKCAVVRCDCDTFSGQIVTEIIVDILEE
jgi:hypothetical protein